MKRSPFDSELFGESEAERIIVLLTNLLDWIEQDESLLDGLRPYIKKAIDRADAWIRARGEVQA